MANPVFKNASESQTERDIVLYYSPGACSLAVHIVLEELGLPYELKMISVFEKETSHSDFLKINPKGRVPVLKYGNTFLTEAPAILVHAASLKPASGLFPSEPLDSFRCLEWLNWLSSTVHAVGYGQLWRPERFTDDSTQFEDIVGKGGKNIAESYRHIENLLTGRAWSVGESYSCADPFLLVFYLWGTAIGFAMQDDYPEWSTHSARVLSRDAVQRAMEQEGLPIPRDIIAV